MPFTNPDTFQVIGSKVDRVGSGEIAQGLVIGGGANEGQDESTILVQNAHHVQTQVARSAGGLTTYGETGASQTPWETTNSSGYTDLGRMRMQLGESRADVTILLDFEDGRIRVGIYDAQTNTLIGSKVESTDSTGRTVEEVSYTSLTATDIVVVFEGKRNTTELSVFLARVLPDKGALDDGATFRKIDDDAAGGNEPYDAFLLHGLNRNTEAAYTAQNRRWSTFWPDADAPVLACHKAVAYPIKVWHVGPDDSELTLHLWHRVDDAAVNLALAAVDLTTGEYFSGDFSEVSTGTDLDTDLTLDVSGRRGRPLMLLLAVHSEDSGTTLTENVTSSSGTPDNKIIDRHLVSPLSSLSGTPTAGDRWKIDFSDPSGSFSSSGTDYPETRTIAFQSGSDWHVWPLYPDSQVGEGFRRPGWLDSDYTITITVIGQTTVYSVGVSVSAVRSRSSLTGLLRPGLAPSALAVGKIYARQRRLFVERTRLHGGGGYDPDNVGVWGSIARYSNDWRDLAACTIAHDTSATDVDGSTALTRRTIDIDAVVWIVSRNRRGAERQVDFDIRASLANFGSGVWASNVDNSTQATATRVPTSGGWNGEGTLASAQAVQYTRGLNRLASHYIRGALDVGELRRRRIPFVYIRHSIVDTQTADPSQRLLRLELRGRAEDSNGADINVGSDQYQFDLLAWEARTREGIGG